MSIWLSGMGQSVMPTSAPYDGILITAATPEIPQPLIDQLAEGGGLWHRSEAAIFRS